MDKNTINKKIFNLGSFGPHGTKCVSNSMVPFEGKRKHSTYTHTSLATLHT